MSEEETPWWRTKCTHNTHDYSIDHLENQYGCWRVLQETEGAAVLLLKCMRKIHILVDLPGKAHVCQTMRPEDYYEMTPRDLLQFVQSQRTYLKTL